MIPERLKKFSNPIPVLNDGHVALIDVMGEDQDVVNAARISYGSGTKKVRENRHLIRYLMRARHTTPFEMCEIKLRVRVPMDVWRQWIRHRTASVNEYSTRYSEAINSTVTTSPNQWRLQNSSNKQGSEGFLTEWPADCQHSPTTPGEYLSGKERELQKISKYIYQERLDLGVAREQARKDLPLSTYTEAYWKIDLHNLFHFLRLRLDSHAQYEIRQYANAIAEIVKEWVPLSWEAFEDYHLRGINLTKFDIEGIRNILKKVKIERGEMEKIGLEGMGIHTYTPSGNPSREAKEFLSKLDKLLKEDT